VKVAGIAALGGLEIPYGFQQPLKRHAVNSSQKCHQLWLSI